VDAGACESANGAAAASCDSAIQADVPGDGGGACAACGPDCIPDGG
jgi:hypothetical protein